MQALSPVLGTEEALDVWQVLLREFEEEESGKLSVWRASSRRPSSRKTQLLGSAQPSFLHVLQPLRGSRCSGRLGPGHLSPGHGAAPAAFI